MKMEVMHEFAGTERFTIVRRIGAGGMGIVYEAYDKERDVRVALKTLPRVDAAALYRFKQEFRTLADVVHPNLVALYQLISVGEQWFFTMEYVPGCDFLDYVRPQAVPSAEVKKGVTSSLSTSQGETVDHFPDEAKESGTDPRLRNPTFLGPEQHDRLRAALRQLADGLCALHEAGKLHRDIKPSNVLVTPQGRVVILDFGLATELEERPLGQGTEPVIAGTVSYMSPEQALGRKLTEASDWYCVGAMLYEVLTGQPPFTGERQQVMKEKFTAEPPSPSELVGGIPPDLDTLCHDLLRLKPADRPTGAEVLRRLGGMPARPAVTVAKRPFQATIFVGRQRHLAALDDALRTLKQRRPVVMDVHGRSGAGKSFLVQHFLEGVLEKGNVVVLAGRCFEQESVPYKALDSLIDSLTRHLKRLPKPDAAVVMPRDVLALARLFPVLRRVDVVANAPVHGSLIPDQQELRRRAFGALRELLARIGDRVPLILTIDDLQWGDVDSAALLTDLLRPPDPPILMLLCSYRSEYAQSSACLRVLSKAHAEDATLDCRQLEVAALEPAEARALALELLGEDKPGAGPQAEMLARESGGSPYFIHVLAEHLRGGAALADSSTTTGQITLDEVLWQRILCLPNDARRLLECVAVSGKPLQQVDAYKAAGLTADQLAALTLLRVGNLVRSTGTDAHDEVETFHDRVRETVSAHLAEPTAREHHRNLAAVLESAGHADPETLAVHYEGACEPIKAGNFYALAAAEAAEALAFERAAKLYRRSLELRPQEGNAGRDWRRKLADALANAGRGAEAAREYQIAAGEAEGAEALELLGRAGFQFCASGHIDEGRAALVTVLERLGLKLPGTRKRALLSLLWNRFKLWLRGLKVRERDAVQVPPEDLARIDTSWSAAVGLTMIDTIRGADFQTRNLLLALRAGEPYRLARALAWEATHAAMAGEGSKKRSARLLEAADALAGRIDNPHALGMATMGRGVAAYFHGAWKEARAVCDQATDIFRNRCTGVTWELDTASAFAFWSLWFQGELAELIRRFPILVKEAHERGDRLAEANYTTFGGPFVWLAADQPDGAREALANAMGEWSKQEFHVQHFTTLTARTQIELYRGNGPAALQHMNEQWPGMAGSMLLHVECVRIFLVHLRARCALAAAATSKDAASLLRQVAKDAHRLEKEKPPWSRPLPQILRAALAFRDGDKIKAANMLGAAAAALDGADMKLFAATARRRQGQLLGGENGRTLLTLADTFMTGQKIQNPERMTELFVPGFG
jgi:serine/threonine protein kinase/tetratricopeptide (TPR) repeat protein